MSTPEQVEADHGDLVVVGSSAGGVEALSVLVSTFPPDFSAPVVLAQHLDPNRFSNLGAILERRSTLPIVVLESQATLQPGTVYVVPANRHVSIQAGTVVLEGDHAGRPRPSVDLLLSTAAAAYGERLIAVILTGSGSDGAAGAVGVKQAGGTVVIQNPKTARYPSMPLALPPTAVDYAVDLELIGPLLYDIIKGIALRESPELTGDALNMVLEKVGRRTTINFRSYKPSTLIRRITRRMAVTHTTSMDDYAAHLEANPEEIGELVMAFLIKVTEFFRDPEAFDYLRNQVLPTIIKRGRTQGRVLRFWSAGCATGEEPYSLALLLADLLDRELSQWNIKIFATDLDSGAISFARRGIYPGNVLNNLPDTYQQRFFEASDHGFRVTKTLRQMVIFGEQDLSRGVPFPRIDLVVCRNLLIYFKPELQQHVLDLFSYSLYQVNGFLFLGKAETARPSKATFELIDKRWKVYQCTNGPLAIPAQHHPALGMLPTADRPISEQNIIPADQQGLDAHRVAPEFELSQIRRFNELLFRFLPTGVAVIDHSYRIVTINSTARRMLSIRDAGIGQDFLHTVRGLPYAEVRDAIDTVFRERSNVMLPDLILESQLHNEVRYLVLSIALLHPESGSSDLAVVSMIDATEQTQTRQRLEAVQAEQRQLLDELSSTNNRLSDVNKELQDTNEELQAANEELMLAQEELQATNEEFEATNEELQAANEELETNNEELQATNEELETTNDELTARTNELQDLMRMLANEQRRLSDMVTLAPLAMLVLRGSGLMVEAATPFYDYLLHGRELLNISLDDLLGDLDGGRLITLAHESYRTDAIRKTERISMPVPDAGTFVTRSFVYTISPTHDSSGRVDGLIVYADDVTEQVVREAAYERGNLSRAVDSAGAAVLALFDAHTTALVGVSPGYSDFLRSTGGANADGIAGLPWRQVALLTTDQDTIAVWNQLLEQHTPLHLPAVHRVITEDGRTTSWDVILTPIMEAAQADTVRFIMVAAAEAKG